ncbi:MAG: NAD(P)/FAD-dependent oxidoreductase [Endomicrobium sp.]|jgi:flavin-dependent dehydrogenase|nr:NAD(P)/FAD-dependent oxidoreductase [Endomicrobium sp.]
MKEIYDVCIMGAGPSGMMAAIQAGQKGLEVLIYRLHFQQGLLLGQV